MKVTQDLLLQQPWSLDENCRSKCLSLLEYLGKCCEVELEPLPLLDAIAQAERDIPGPWQSTWVHRLIQLGNQQGLVICPVRADLPQAQQLARPNEPAVTFVDGDLCANEWLVLRGNRMGMLEMGNGQAVSWLPNDKGAQIVAAAKTEEEDGLLTWVTVRPAAPCQSLQAAKEEHHHHHGPSPLARTLQLLRQDRNDLWVVAIFALGVGIFSLATPIAVEAIVSSVQGGTDLFLQPVIALSIVLVVFLGLAAALRAGKAYVVEYLQQRIFVRVVADLAHRLPRVRQEAFDGKHGPELVNRFFSVLTVQKASAVLLIDGLSVVLQTVIGLAVLAMFNPFLLGFDVVLIAAIAFMVFVLGRGAVRTSIDESYAKYGVAGWLEEMARNPLAFKMGGSAFYALTRADFLARKYIQARQSHFRILFRQIVFALFLQAFAFAALFGLGGWLVINRGLTLGQLVAAELILIMIVGSFIKLGKSLESYYDLMAAVDKLGHLIDLPLESSKGENLPLSDGPASLELCNLSYAFPGAGKRKLFDALSFQVEPGERIAIVGPQGAGKSTLMDLIYGLRMPQSGHVEFDGIDLRDLRPEALRSHVSLVRGLEIFDGTIVDNIRVGRSYSLKEVRAALTKVGLLEELQKLPDGLNTRLSTGGSPLSYGQARRLMLARAIISGPRLLLVDEVLDEMHNGIKEKLLNVLLDKDAPWTLLVVTHSSEVARQCDRQLTLAE